MVQKRLNLISIHSYIAPIKLFLMRVLEKAVSYQRWQLSGLFISVFVVVVVVVCCVFVFLICLVKQPRMLNLISGLLLAC